MKNNSRVSKVGLNPIQWTEVYSDHGTQEGAAKIINPKNKRALSYHPQPAYWADSKEIVQAWFRNGNAHASIGVIEFVKQLLAHLSNGMRINVRVDSGYFVDALLIC